MKMIAIAPHLWFVQPLLASYITFGVGYCLIHSKRQKCEEPKTQDKADIVPTPYLLLYNCFLLGIGGQMNQPVIMNVANKKEKPCYLHPQMDVLFIETSKHLLSGSGDPTITNPDMEWGARDFETLECIEKIKNILE